MPENPRRPVSWAIAISLLVVPLFGQGDTQKKLNLSTGKDIFLAACVGCHGADGKGAPEASTVFKRPSTFPDFSDCAGTTPELDVDWKSTVIEGGLARGFSRIMPSFKDALTPEQIDMVVAYLRGMCTEKKWPRGELNLPRPMFTEKAFPEDEIIMTSTTNVRGNPGVEGEAVYERAFGARTQIEASVPFGFTHDEGRWVGGVGDLGLGVKRVLFSSIQSGSILSVEGLVSAATGNPSKGLGDGTTSFETFASFGQILPSESFVQAQVGGVFPTHTKTAPRNAYWRMAFGKTFREDHGTGRMWTPITELIASRDFATGEKNNWNVVPQFQVSLSRRQHVRADIGVSVPVNNTAGRPVQLVFYLLWDWFDGGLTEGWK